MRKTFIDTLVEQAKLDEDIFLITPDMGFGVLEPFKELFPERFLNAGISEQNAISVASGLALSGKKVYVYSIIPFVTMRCFEQVRLDVAYMNTNVKLVGVGAGFTYGSAGATHHSIEDIAIMRALPNMTICCPGDNIEAEAITKQSTGFDGPMYIRIGRHNKGLFNAQDAKIEIGKSSVIQQGKDVAIISTSNTLPLAKDYVESLEAQGRSAALVSMHTVKPLDEAIINELVDKEVSIVALEEHNKIGGLGSAIAEVIAKRGKAVKFKSIGVPDEYSHYVGNQDFIREKYAISNQDLSGIC